MENTPEDTANAKPSKSSGVVKTNSPNDAMTKSQKAEIAKQAYDSRQQKNDLVAMQATNVLDPVAFAQMKEVAQTFYDAGAIGKQFENTEQILMALMAGHQLGMTFQEAVTGLYFVNGQLNIYGKQTPAVLRRAGWKHVFVDEIEGKSCTVIVWKGDAKYDPEKEQMMPDPENIQELYKDTFDVSEADKSGFTTDSYGKKKVGWRDGKNIKRKLRYEVLSLVIHTYLPEVLSGVAGIGEVSERYQAEINETRQSRVQKDNIQKRLDDVSIEGEVADENFKPTPVKPITEQE